MKKISQKIQKLWSNFKRDFAILYNKYIRESLNELSKESLKISYIFLASVSFLHFLFFFLKVIYNDYLSLAFPPLYIAPVFIILFLLNSFCLIYDNLSKKSRIVFKSLLLFCYCAFFFSVLFYVASSFLWIPYLGTALLTIWILFTELNDNRLY